MYTVARFLIGQEQLSALQAVGEKMNAVRPGIFQGLRSRGDGIAIDVADGSRWDDQSAAIISFVRELKEQIRTARRLGASVTIDVAVEPEDAGRIPLVLRQEPELMQELASEGIALEVSIYVSSTT